MKTKIFYEIKKMCRTMKNNLRKCSYSFIKNYENKLFFSN